MASPAIFRGFALSGIGAGLASAPAAAGASGGLALLAKSSQLNGAAAAAAASAAVLWGQARPSGLGTLAHADAMSLPLGIAQSLLKSSLPGPAYKVGAPQPHGGTREQAYGMRRSARAGKRVGRRLGWLGVGVGVVAGVAGPQRRAQ
jgi:hypothetical protein